MTKNERLTWTTPAVIDTDADAGNIHADVAAGPNADGGAGGFNYASS